MDKESSQIIAILRRLGPVSVMALIASTLPAVGALALLSLSGYIGPWIKNLGPVGVPLYVGSITVLCGFAVMSTNAFSLLGGWAFGLKMGALAAVLGMTCAATLAYVLARWASGDRVTSLLKEHPKWEAVYATLLASGFWKTLVIVLLVRLPAQFPFALTNLVLSATRVHPVAYVMGTLIGLAPRTTAVVWVGSRLKHLDLSNAEDTWMFISSVVVTIGVLALLGYLGNRAITNLTQSESS
jgi:uncharacterized membrane protein YdjX (TVP38/TMEM64 family)